MTLWPVCSLWLSNLVFAAAGIGDGYALRFLNDSYACTGTNTRGSRSDHLLGVLKVANTAGSFYAHLRSGNCMAHEPHVVGRRAPRAEACGRFHKVGSGAACGQAASDFFVVVKKRRFQNYLANGAAIHCRFDNGPN